MKINITKQGSILSPYSENDEDRLNKLSDGTYSVDLKDMDTRTLQQNKSLHKWASQISDTLNANNLYMKGIFGGDIEWTMSLVKEQIIKSVAKKIFNVSSTTKLKKKEIDQLIDYIAIALAKKGIVIPEFPSKVYFDDKNCDTVIL